jgi:hypothetical protein
MGALFAACPSHTPRSITPQGMTLDSLEVDLANCFDAGQAYVAT